MKKIFRNVLLATSVVVSFGPIYAHAWSRESVVVDIIEHLPEVPEGQSSIVNIGVNTAEIDASVSIYGESIKFEGEGRHSSQSFENGSGALGNSLGGGISWANSIETSAIGANVATNFIGDQSVSATLDMEYEKSKRCGRTNTEFELNASYSTYYPSIINVAYNTQDINASVQIGSSSHHSGTERVSLENLHISTQAVGVNSVINVANTYQ
jgi:hypothetical protein